SLLRRRSPHPALYSFPTRRSSDLFLVERPIKVRERSDAPFSKTSFGMGIGDNLKDFFSSGPATKGPVNSKLAVAWGANFGGFGTDRKSPRLNSSHGSISYAI